MTVTTLLYVRPRHFEKLANFTALTAVRQLGIDVPHNAHGQNGKICDIPPQALAAYMINSFIHKS